MLNYLSYNIYKVCDKCLSLMVSIVNSSRNIRQSLNFLGLCHSFYLVQQFCFALNHQWVCVVSVES